MTEIVNINLTKRCDGIQVAGPIRVGGTDCKYRISGSIEVTDISSDLVLWCFFTNEDFIGKLQDLVNTSVVGLFEFDTLIGPCLRHSAIDVSVNTKSQETTLYKLNLKIEQ